jgi:DNA-binding LacI/PurR family transcriptional regulator
MDWFDGRVRKRGWEGALRDAGLSPGLCLEGDWSPAWAYEAGLRLVEEGQVPQAIFAASDHTALGLIRALSESGLRVPEDVSVVGFDDSRRATESRPQLTTVHQEVASKGQEAVRALMAVMGPDRPDSVERILLPTSLVVRDSTAPPAA